MAAPIVRYELREVLADAYLPCRASSKLHTHTVAIAEDGTAAPICNRVKAENLADAGSLSQVDREAMPTCPACLRRLRALAREALRG